MNDVALERIARRLVEEIRAGRRTVFTSSSDDVRNRVVARVRALLAGRTLEESPD